MRAQLVAHAQRAGAVGFMFVNYWDDLFTYIPYQLSFNLTLPFVNVMETYGTNLIERIRNEGDVRLTFPNFTYSDPTCDHSSAVCIASGPPVVLSVPAYLSHTAILVIATATGESEYVEAGQADFNPPGLASPDDPSSIFAVNASVVKAEFDAACANRPESDACKPCFSDLESKLLNSEVLPGKVVLVRLLDVGCVTGYSQIVVLMEKVGAKGVLIASASETLFPMYAETGYKATIPTFSIKAADAAWILERAAVPAGRRRRWWEAARGWRTEVWSGLRAVAGVGVAALLPRIDAAGHAAPFDVISGKMVEGCPVKTVNPVQLEVLNPAELRQKFTAGGAAFNPPTWTGKQELAVMARWSSCGNLESCMQCDSQQVTDLINRADMQGRVMLHWQSDAVCLDASEAAKYAQVGWHMPLLHICEMP